MAWIVSACTAMVASSLLAVWAFAYGRPDAALILVVACLLSALAMCAGADLVPIVHEEQEARR